MESLIININSPEEKEFITQLLNKLGIESISIEDYEFHKRMEVRRKFAKLVEESPKIDISDEEIDAIVEEVRTKRYEENNH